MQKIKVILSSRNFGILQKNNVSNKEGTYLGYQLIEKSTMMQMGKVLYYGYVVLLLAIYLFTAISLFNRKASK